MGGMGGTGSGAGGARTFLSEPSSTVADDLEVASIFGDPALGPAVVGAVHPLPARDSDAVQGLGGVALSSGGGAGVGGGGSLVVPLRPKPQSPLVVWGAGEAHASPGAVEGGPGPGCANHDDAVGVGPRLGPPRVVLPSSTDEHGTGDGYSSQGTSSSSRGHPLFTHVDVGKVSVGGVAHVT